jgi:hypothetical protein
MGFQKKIVPWMSPFYDNQEGSPMKFDAPQQQSHIKVVTEWSNDYLRWLHDLHQCDTDRVQLFNTQLFGAAERLDQIIIDDSRDAKTRQRQDDLGQIKTALMRFKSATGPRGTAGLATALYQTTNI